MRLRCARMATLLIAGTFAPLLLRSSPLACLSDVEIPRFATASMAPNGGTVSAQVVIDARGKPKSITVEGSAKPSVTQEVTFHLRNARYKANCRPSVVRLEFSFRVEGAPTPTPFARTVFVPPNRFEIVTQPAAPIVDMIKRGEEDERRE